MPYLVAKYQNSRTEWVVDEKQENRAGRQIAVGDIPPEKLTEVLQIMNGEGRFSADVQEEIKICDGFGIRDSSYFRTVFGEVDKQLESEGPFFRGLNGETKGHFSHYTIKPKTNVAILIRETKSNYFSEKDGKNYESVRGEVYFLRKAM